MANALKVRLEDGSEIGPLDLGMVQAWFQRGLIARESMVQKPGNPRWIRLSEAVDLSGWNAPLVITSRGRGTGARAGASVADSAAEATPWQLFVASALLFVLALGAGLISVWPERVRPELDGAPWVQIALSLTVLGLALVRGWELGRRVVRAVVLLAAGAALPLAGFFLAQGTRGEALLMVAAAWLLAVGFFAFLAADPSRLASVAALIGIVLGGVGLVRFGRAEASAAPAVAPWVTGDRRIAEPEIGLAVDLPPGWLVLKPGNPLVKAPAEARVALAQPRVSGYALLLLEPPPADVRLLEHYLDHVIAERRGSAGSFEEEWRRDGRLGRLESRRASSRRGSPEGRFMERAVVAQDGDRFFALIAWVPESGGGRSLQEIDALEAAVSLSGVRGAGRRDVVQKASLELPHLSVQAIRDLVESTGPGSPSELFRRAVTASARGLASLGPPATQELRALNNAALAALPKRERARLSDYLERVTAGQAIQSEEDEPMRLLMKEATAALGAAQRQRLQELAEAALRSGLKAQTTGP